MFNELLIVMVSVVIVSCSIIIYCGIVHYGLKVQVGTGASSPKGTTSGIAMMFHVLILVSNRHRLVHHGYLLQVEIVPCLTRDASSCRSLLLPSCVTRHVMLMMMEVGCCIVLLAHLQIVMLLC